MTHRCKHGIIQGQCGDCRDLPPYVEKPPHSLIVKPKEKEEKPMPEEKVFLSNNGKQKRVCVICKNEPHLARGLGSKCYSLWRAGEIEHPELGKFFKTEKGQKMVNVKRELKKSIEPDDGFKVDMGKDKISTETVSRGPAPEPIKTLHTDPYIIALRERLKDAKALCTAMKITGNLEGAKAEIAFFLKGFI